MLDRATQLDPSDWEAFAAKGWALENLGKAQEGMQAYRIALEKNPEDLWIQKGFANTLHLLGNVEEAKRNTA